VILLSHSDVINFYEFTYTAMMIGVHTDSDSYAKISLTMTNQARWDDDMEARLLLRCHNAPDY
jgi:hypothetical protein